MRNNKKTGKNQKKCDPKMNRRNDKQSKVREDEYSDRSDRGNNDPSWYTQLPEIAAPAANIQFNFAAGVPFELSFKYDNSTNVVANKFVVPGIMTLSLIPLPGYTSAGESPVNVASRNLYSFIRHANSGSANYDAPDLMLYCLAMGNVYSYINFLQRIYGSIFVYANMNRYLPKALLTAQGVNFNDVEEHISDFRMGINSLIHKASSLAVPSNLAYFQRLAFLFSNIYSEGESIKSQLYMYVPDKFLQFSETGSKYGGSLQPMTWNQGGTSMTVKSMIDFGNSLLTPILNSEDMNIMSGDILKAYGTAGILKLAPIPEMYQVVPVTNLEVLEQFKNANWIGSSRNSLVMEVTQDSTSGYLVTTASATFAPTDAHVPMIPLDHILNTILTAPNVGDVLVRTRGMFTSEITSVTSTSIDMVFNFPTEVGSELKIWQYDENMNIQRYNVPQTHILNNIQPGGNDTTGSIISEHCQLENFKFHPIVYYYDKLPDGTYVLLDFATDMDNYTIIAKQTLDKINESVMLSLFNVNNIAKAY